MKRIAVLFVALAALALAETRANAAVIIRPVPAARVIVRRPLLGPGIIVRRPLVVRPVRVIVRRSILVR